MDQACSFEVDVTEGDVIAFSQLSGDWNPLHTKPDYARTTEYGRPIVHGAFLVGLVSRVLGMHIPGTRSLILSMRIQFPKPLFYPARIRVEGRLKFFDKARGMGSVQVSILDLAKLWPVLEAEVSFALHAVVHDFSGPTGQPQQSEKSVNSQEAQEEASTKQGRPLLLVTGGTGGLGARMLPILSSRYGICCLTRKSSQVPSSSLLAYEQVDLDEEGALERWLEQRNPHEFYGILHLSVPPVVRAFVSDDLLSVHHHLHHAVDIPLMLAKWARQANSGVKRMVLMGSTFGSKAPKPNLGAYSLGKAAMEHVTRLLTADLSAQGATINVIVPTVIPVGLNEGLPERAQKSLAGKMPTGRLIEPTDVANVILFLLSTEATQINGATIVVDGGVAE